MIDQAQLHADDYVDKNYPDEREVSKLKEASMQNEPQLSAEMEEELQIVIGEALDKIDNQDGSSLISQGNFETAGFILPEVLHFLATALEEQRNQGLKDALVLAYDLADEKGTLNYGKLHRQVELALRTQKKEDNESR